MIALAAGGTGGHMFPAEALAQELKRRGHTVLLVTDARGDRYTKNFPYDHKLLISAGSPSIGGVLAKAIAAVKIVHGFAASLREFKRRGVDIAVGFGGYPSLPAMKSAAFMKIPYGIHEQNGVLGRANRLLARQAAFIGHGFPELERLPAGVKGQVIEVGNPVRDAVKAVAGAAYPALAADGPIHILVFGGSQGASVFARHVPGAINALPAEIKARLRIVQQVREADLLAARTAYESIGVNVEIEPFFSDLPEKIKASHLVIARAGASTVTEIATIGRPSILVPLPIAMDDHQAGNAKNLSNTGAADLVREDDQFAENLSNTLRARLMMVDSLPQLAHKALNAVKPQAAEQVADLVDEVLAKGQTS